MNHAERWLPRCLLATCLLVAPLVAGAQDAAPERPRRAIDPAASAVLDRMSAQLKGMQTYSISATETRDEVLPLGYKLQSNQSTTVIVQRPDKMRVDVDGDIKTRTYIYDGKTLTVHAGDRGVYAQVPAPDTIGGTLQSLLDRGVEMPLIDVLYQAHEGTLLEGVRFARLVGETDIGGVACDHLAFRQATIDWQLWVEKGEHALPRKILITTRYEVGDPQYSATMDWNLKPKVDRKAFAFKPSATDRQIRFNDDVAAAGGKP